MKRYGNLWDRMISFESLLQAAHAAARGKRFKPGVARFVFDLERQLLLLHEELASKTYRPGPYRTFTIYEGKTRQITPPRSGTGWCIRPRPACWSRSSTAVPADSPTE